MDKKKLARKILGDKIYGELRTQQVFNGLDHPFPMQKLLDIRVNWDGYLSPADDHQDVCYIVSPTQRSGTNFLSNILDYHPDIQFPKSDTLPMEHCLFSAAPFLREYIERTLTFWGKWVQDEHAVDGHAKRMIAQFGDGMIRDLKSYIQPGQKLLLKTPDAGGIKWFFHLFPSGKLVLLIRDGRDTMESFMKSWGGKGGFRKMTERWADRVHQITEMEKIAERSGFSGQIHRVSYESLNRDPESEMRKVLEFLNQDISRYPWDKLAEAPILGSSAFKDEGAVHWKPVERTEDFKPVQKWTKWPKSQRETFKQIAGDMLVSLGYESDLNW